MKTRTTRPIMERFENFIEPEPNSGCWLWMGQLNHGYGAFRVGGKYGRHMRAHRFAYEYFRGPIPVGLTIDHLCRVRSCVNPKHLEVVPIAVNLKRSSLVVSTLNTLKTECLRGHPFSRRFHHGKWERYCVKCSNWDFYGITPMEKT